MFRMLRVVSCFVAYADGLRYTREVTNYFVGCCDTQNMVVALLCKGLHEIRIDFEYVLRVDRYLLIVTARMFALSLVVVTLIVTTEQKK